MGSCMCASPAGMAKATAGRAAPSKPLSAPHVTPGKRHISEQKMSDSENNSF